MMWRVYQKALLPASLPPYSENPDLELTKVLKKKKCFFARYVSDFDCNQPTEWWYCIKDDILDLEKLKAKRRYEIVKALKNVDVRIIQPGEHIRELYRIAVNSFSEYPKYYRPQLTLADFEKRVMGWLDAECFGAFDRESGKLCGYAVCELKKDCLFFSVLKVDPAVVSKKANAALVYHICVNYLNDRKVRCVCDGERNIRHETNFQSYLVKYFGFRYAYCHLHVVYLPWVKVCVNLLYPFRKIIKRLSALSPYLYNVYSVLKQEEIRRTF